MSIYEIASAVLTAIIGICIIGLAVCAYILVIQAFDRSVIRRHRAATAKPKRTWRVSACHYCGEYILPARTHKTLDATQLATWQAYAKHVAENHQ